MDLVNLHKLYHKLMLHYILRDFALYVMRLYRIDNTIQLPTI